MWRSFFIRSFVNGHLEYPMYWFIFFGYIFRNKITESYDSSVFRETSKLYSIKPMAIFLPRNARGSFSLHLSLHLLSFVFLTIVIPTSLSPYLIMIFICAFLMTSDVEYIFIYLMVIHMSSLGKKMPIQVLFPFFKSTSLIFSSTRMFEILTCFGH